MKTAQLPPVRVEPSVRDEIQSVLVAGETLSGFIESAVLMEAGRRKAQQAFLARGRAALHAAKQSGEFYAADAVLDQMQQRLADRVAELRQAKPPAPQP